RVLFRSPFRSSLIPNYLLLTPYAYHLSFQLNNLKNLKSVYCTMSQSIKLYNILLDKNFTKEEAESVVSELEGIVDGKFDIAKNTLATKEDVNKLMVVMKDDISKVILWMVGLILGQTGLIFLILQ